MKNIKHNILRATKYQNRSNQTTALSNTVNYTKGKKPKLLSNARKGPMQIPYINIKALEHGIFEEFTDGEKCNLCIDGDILMVWDGARAGFTGKAKAGAVGSTLMKIEPKENLNKNYLYYFLQSLYHKLNTNPRGIGIPHVEPSLLWNTAIYLPSLSEQETIVTKLETLFSELDKGIEQLKYAKQLLSTYRQAILKAAFEGRMPRAHKDDIGLPPSWKILPLKDIVLEKDGLRRGPFGSAIKKEFFVPQGYKVYEQGNAINDDPYRGNYFIDKNKYNELKNFSIEPGDLLVSCSGATLGRITELPKDAQPGIINQALLRIRLNQDLVSNAYFKYYFRASFFQKLIFTQSQGTAMPNLVGIKDFKEILLNIPPRIVQERIVAEVQSRLCVADKLDITITETLIKTRSIRQSILEKAFDGML